MKNRALKVFTLFILSGSFLVSCDDGGSDKVSSGAPLVDNLVMKKPSAEVSERARAQVMENARGAETEGPEGEVVYSWGDVKKIPDVFNVFSAVRYVSDELRQASYKTERELMIIGLFDTEDEERKRILEGLWEGDYQEMDDAQFFYGLQNPSGDCVVELYGKIRYDEGKEVSRDSWIRGVDPETHEVLWKNEDTGLWRMGIDQGITWADYGFTYYFGVDTRVKFAKDKKVFLMTNLRYDDKDETGSTHSTNNPVYKVKGFSCETGYINDIFVYESKESKPISPMAIISDDGSRVVYANLKEIVVYDNELGRVLWSQKDEGQLVIGGFHMSDDRKYLLVLRESPSNVKNEGCCGRFQLHDMESGEVIWSKSVTMDLGDKDYYPDYDVGRLISGDLSSDGAVAIIYFGPHEARSSLLVNKRGEHLMVADTFEILEYKGRLLLEGKRFYDISEFVKEQGGPFPTDR